MLNPGNDFRFSAFFSVAAIGSNHDKPIKLKKILFVNTPNKKSDYFINTRKLSGHF